MSMTSVAWPLMTAEPRTPAVLLAISISSRSSTMSTISSTIRPMERPSSREHQQRLRAAALDAHVVVDRHQRHELAAILHDRRDRWCVSMVLGSISSSRVTSDSGTAFGCGEPARNSSMDSTCRPPASRSTTVSAIMPRGRRAGPIVCATPFGSTIMITEPSPRMVLPQNIEMCRSLLDIGFTTISSVWNTASTTMPKVWLPTCVTTMKPFSTSLSASSSILSSAAQPEQRQQLVAQPQHRGVLDALDAMLRIVAHAHQLDHRQLRDREAIAGALHDQRGDDRERQRNLDDEARALAEHRLHVDDAADLIDVGAHDVHADAAAGDARHLRRGREAGREDELLDLRLRHLVDLGFGDQTAGDRLRLDARGVEAAPVVGDLDDDVAAFVPGGEPDRALLGLAGGAPLGRHLEAVVGRVAHHVDQRVLDQIEHLPVELGLGAVHLEFDRLAELGGEVAHDPRQLLPRIADRLHARLHHAFLQLGGDVREPLQRRLEFGILVPPADLEQLVAREHQLRDHGHQVLERVDMHADRLVRDLAVGALVVAAVGRRRWRWRRPARRLRRRRSA